MNQAPGMFKGGKRFFLSIVILFEFTNLDTPTPSFWIDSKFDNINLEAVSRLFKKEKFYATGNIEVRIYLKGQLPPEIHTIDIRLNSLEPGGELKTPLLSKLIYYIPQDSIRDAIIATLERNTFIFKKAGIDVSTKEKDYNLHILLDGQHLLEFNINVSEDMVNAIVNKFTGGGR